MTALSMLLAPLYNKMVTMDGYSQDFIILSMRESVSVLRVTVAVVANNRGVAQM